MASSAESGGIHTYFIPIPSMGRAIALAYVAFFLTCFMYISIKLGPSRTFVSVGNDPFPWIFLILTFGMTIVFFLRLAFPPRSWLARLEFARDRVRFVPKPILRWIGEPSSEIPLSLHSKEILLCRGSQGNSPYGFRVLLRSESGQDREIKVETGYRLNLRESAILTNLITAATALPVRMVQRRVLTGGGTEETPWTPVGRSAELGALAKLAFAALPFIGGGVVGFLGSTPLFAAAFGAVLWLNQTLAVFILARDSHQRSRPAMLYWLTTLFTFGASYAATVVVVSFLFRSR
jgi:hypothetical protein